MQEKWKSFVYPLIEDRKQDVEEESYHLHIENQLIPLGWAPWRDEIKHKPNLRIGNRKSIQPDILVANDGEEQFVIEVKRPNHVQQAENIEQLESYMRQLKLKVGIYIGERMEIFYDQPDSRHVVSVLQIPLLLDEKRGSRFVELFSKDNFSKKAIVDFCKERIKEMQRQASLNKIKESLIADAQTQITESLRPYLQDKYGESFSEDEIKAMLATIQFTATSTDRIIPEHKTEPVKVVPAEQKNIIKCLLTRNAKARGEFNTEDQSLTVLKGSKVNPVHLDKFKEAYKRARERQLAEFTDEINGERIVKTDVRFDTPSGAAVFCVGGSANGWDVWKDEQGRELNEYRKQANDSSAGIVVDKLKKMADPKKIQLDFWTRFREKLQETGKIPTLQTPQAHNWYDVRIGRSNILLNLVCNTQKDFLGVKLYIRNQVADVYFPALTARRNEINQALGCEPEWDSNPKAKDKTVALFHKTDLSDPIKQEEAMNWLVGQTVIFYNVFSEEVKRISLPK